MNAVKTVVKTPTKSLVTAVMKYKHEGLIERLQDKLEMSEQDALELFQDTKRFLFICGTKKGSMGPPELIDECWHHFILFTKDYESFCRTFFGRFIHHSPKMKAEIAQGDGTPAKNTLDGLHEIFGEVDPKNWIYPIRNLSGCSGSTNCQDSGCTAPDY